MPFSFQQPPVVKDCVRNAFAQMRLNPDEYPMLYTFMVFAFLPTARVVEDAALDVVRDTEANKDVAARIENITRTIREAWTYAGPVNTPSEALMGAIAVRETYDEGVQGFAMLSKYPEAGAFIYTARGIYQEFRRVNAESIPARDVYQKAGPAAQLVVQMHALDEVRRSLLRISQDARTMTPAEKNDAMWRVNRFRPLMSEIGTPAGERFGSLLTMLDAALLAPRSAAARTEPAQVMGQVIPFDTLRRRGARLV